MAVPIGLEFIARIIPDLMSTSDTNTLRLLVKNRTLKSALWRLLFRPQLTCPWMGTSSCCISNLPEWEDIAAWWASVIHSQSSSDAHRLDQKQLIKMKSQMTIYRITIDRQKGRRLETFFSREAFLTDEQFAMSTAFRLRVLYWMSLFFISTMPSTI